MDPISIEKVVNPCGCSFRVEAYSHPYFEAPLHIHTQYELISIEQGTGYSFVGDSIFQHKPGDFMLIGKNIPHLWLSDDKYYIENTPLMSGSVFSQFDIDIFPNDLSCVCEFEPIHNLLKESQRGLFFIGDSKTEIQNRFRELPGKSNFNKLISMYAILNDLACNCEYKVLTTDYYRNTIDDNLDHTIKRTFAFISKNYQKEISLEDIATSVGMNPSALCRHFKKKTDITIFEYVAEMRISYAMKLLISRNIPISQIAYCCGYNNLSHFNRQFKLIVKTTPSEYCKSMNIQHSNHKFEWK